MTLRALDGDALHGSLLRVALPWIRSMPLAGVRDLEVRIDGEPVAVTVLLDDRRVAPAELAGEDAWWYLQDRLVLEVPAPGAGPHRVEVSFELEIPYLSAGPVGPLRLPLRDSRELVDGPAVHRAASRDVA